ncbi:EF-hand [Neoconidiobolus thromboides FSU 785]|nr:EF-hand [Neoconidiobolus thromboides FSU 785]
MENKLISRRPEEEISAAFKLFDIDNKGKVTVDNLKRIAQELGEDIAEDELEAMVLEFDLDGDRGINENEFFNIMRAAY